MMARLAAITRAAVGAGCVWAGIASATRPFAERTRAEQHRPLKTETSRREPVVGICLCSTRSVSGL
jgi:hypothetical protein